MGTRAAAQEPSPTPEPSPRTAASSLSEVVEALPSAGSLTARVVQLNAGLVLEREEGVGLFPAEPSRFAFRGGSWTQTRIEIDGFDVTDPVLGGRPLVWGSVELGQVDVVTDASGTALVHTHPLAGSPGRTRFLAQASLGAFDSSGTSADPIPSLARGHQLFDGLLALSGTSGSGATDWNIGISGADVTRSERESDQERTSRRVGFEGRFQSSKGNDSWNGLALYQSQKAPFGFTAGETEGSGLFVGGAWSRRRYSGGVDGGTGETRVRISYLRGTANDPGSQGTRLFERLVDGPADFQPPHESTGQRLQAEGTSRLLMLGDAADLSFIARFSRAVSDQALSQPAFEALETLNGSAARAWTFAGVAPARVAETRAALGLSLGIETSEHTRLVATVEVQRASVNDRDGESILTSTKALPRLSFDWRKSETTSLRVEASMGTPPVPLVNYAAATRGAVAASARLWNDANRDLAAAPSELGVEVVRRGPGSVGLDPALKLPSMRRVQVEFRTKVFGVSVRATAYARRDVDLIETALDPQGGEIQSTRNLEDPSGDILGASDDQILPLIEESPSSFTDSRYLLTNPMGHRALGEGAELGFEASRAHVHWGLVGSAFRDSGRGGNRGLRVGENDFGVVGESFDRTNADTFAYGRLFFDRAYSLKMYLTGTDIKGFTFGAIGRYDDGQPFARLVINDDLPQGPDFVQAIPRGRARLHYTLSVDARLARRFKVGDAVVEFSASVFNALGSKFEAEEQVVWLPDYRRITMVQPPRAFLIGLRIER